MCGIAGAVTSVADALPPIQAMLDRLRHRGPDGEGQRADRHCALGQRRLAIIDLTEAGQGPITNEDGTVWVTFNGEIYNFRELRTELKRLGHRFRGKSDTEVIVHAYEEWGRESFQRLRGMFALAIWDQPKGRLVLARDRVGKKPLFYAQTGDTLLFASELQSLLAMPELARETDLEALQAYLSWGYVPAPLTGFKTVRKLPPGHLVEVDVRRHPARHVVMPYWKLQYRPKLDLSQEDAEERLRQCLAEAVRLRMISDVPLGAFLSGGIDSSVVVGLMAAESTDPVRTFSIGFEDAAYDELAHARRVAELWGTEHHEEVVRPDTINILPLLARHYGEPFADSSAIPTYYVSKMTRQHVTVALNGDGGDESFGGYDRYRAMRWAARVGAAPGLGVTAHLADRFSPQDPKHKLRRAARFFNAAGAAPAERYARWMGYFSPEAKRALCTPDFLAWESSLGSAEWFEDLFAGSRGLDPAEAAMRADVHSYLPYDLLVKVDIASMANSLEGRSPFLDHEVMELAARFPARMKLSLRDGKIILKEAFRDLLPRENVTRPKMGFAVPVGAWLRGPLRDHLKEVLLSGPANGRGYFQRGAVERLIADHVAGHEDHGARLWSLLMLEIWHQEMVEQSMSRSEL